MPAEEVVAAALDQTGQPAAQSFVAYVNDPANIGQDSLASMAMRDVQTALSGRLPDLKLFHKRRAWDVCLRLHADCDPVPDEGLTLRNA